MSKEQLKKKKKKKENALEKIEKGRRKSAENLLNKVETKPPDKEAMKFLEKVEKPTDKGAVVEQDKDSTKAPDNCETKLPDKGAIVSSDKSSTKSTDKGENLPDSSVTKSSDKSLNLEKTARTRSIMSKLSMKSYQVSSQMAPGFGATGKGVVQAPVAVESKRMQNVKRFFFRIKESIGLVEKTEVSKPFTDSLAHLDKYKICLDTLADAVCRTIQENKIYHKENMEMAPPLNKEENEMVSMCLNNLPGFNDYENQKKQVDSYMKQGKERRDYIRRARRSLHNIRTFIQYDYWVIAAHRTELNTLRREMDFAKSELKAAKDAQLIALKNQIYQVAVSAFEEKLKQVTALLDELPRHKQSHIDDLLEWANCTKAYHERMAQLLEECEKG